MTNSRPPCTCAIPQRRRVPSRDGDTTICGQCGGFPNQPEPTTLRAGLPVNARLEADEHGDLYIAVPLKDLRHLIIGAADG